MFHSLFSSILNLLFPLRCLGCGREGMVCCDQCRGALRFVAPSCVVCGRIAPATQRVLPGRTCKACREKSHLDGFWSPFRYETDPLVRDLIHVLKYGRYRAVAPFLANLLIEYCHTFRLTLPRNAIVIPVPLHRRRARVRGFNQSELVACSFASSFEVSVACDALRRAKNTIPQVALSRQRRLGNIRGAFVAQEPGVLCGRTVFLFDDVKTTGTTLEELAVVARQAGARMVWAITIAH